MPRPRKSLEQARLDGSINKDPGRYKSRREPLVAEPLGEPPAWIKNTPGCKAKSAWRLFQKLPWLNRSHRCFVGIASTLQGQIMAGYDVGIQRQNLLRQMLGQMGATPSDFSKISFTEPETDPDDGLFSRESSRKQT